jgi:carboxyl-terminal processing protease
MGFPMGIRTGLIITRKEMLMRFNLSQKTFFNILLIITILVLSFLICRRIIEGKGIYLNSVVLSSPTRDQSNVQKQIKELGDIYQLVKDNFVVEPNREFLFENAIKGMVSSLDPYSEYMNADEYNEFIISTKGEFGGIGVEITIEDGFITVIAPLEDTPAFRAGVMPGDKILKVDSVSTEGMSTSDCARRVRGKPGTSVSLKILHKNDDTPIDITLVREVIRMKSVKDAKVINEKYNIGYVRITAFQEDTAELLREALKQLENQKIRSLIIDLRFNSGGLLESAVKITNFFVVSGTIVSIKGRKIDETRKAEVSESIMPSVKLVILVNGSSASASEIVAGTLQDYQLATLIGSRTYGKGSVQSVFTIKDNSKNIKGALRLTTARYYTPSGRCLERDKSVKNYGLEPDIIVEMAPSEETQLLKARLLARGAETDDETDDFIDVQLERAIQFLSEK